jgi:hypothetical protein
LIKVAISYIYISDTSDPWVTTGCINQDMIKLVGNALHRDMCGVDVPCIGFYDWKSVAGIFIINANALYHSIYNVKHYYSDRHQLEKGSTTIVATSDTRLSVIIIK